MHLNHWRPFGLKRMSQQTIQRSRNSTYPYTGAPSLKGCMRGLNNSRFVRIARRVYERWMWKDVSNWIKTLLFGLFENWKFLQWLSGSSSYASHDPSTGPPLRTRPIPLPWWLRQTQAPSICCFYALSIMCTYSLGTFTLDTQDLLIIFFHATHNWDKFLHNFIVEVFIAFFWFTLQNNIFSTLTWIMGKNEVLCWWRCCRGNFWGAVHAATGIPAAAATRGGWTTTRCRLMVMMHHWIVILALHVMMTRWFSWFFLRRMFFLALVRTRRPTLAHLDTTFLSMLKRSVIAVTMAHFFVATSRVHGRSKHFVLGFLRECLLLGGTKVTNIGSRSSGHFQILCKTETYQVR